jgi:hypothetical protein
MGHPLPAPADRPRPAAAARGNPRQPDRPHRRGRTRRLTGEAEGLKVSLAAANDKLAQTEVAAVRRTQAVSLGMPASRDAAAATITAVPGPGTSR